MPSDESKRLRQSLSTAVHAGADCEAVSSGQLRRAGVFDFLNLDTTDHEDARDLGRAALLDFCVGTDGEWEGIWRTLLPAVLAFMETEGHGRPSREQFKSLSELAQNKPNQDALTDWFNSTYP